MGYLLYNLAIHLGLVVLTPYYLVRMAVSGKYRAGLGQRFGAIDGKLTSLKGGRPAWFHAVSVGEAKAVMPLLKIFKERHPDIEIVFSTVTPTGQAVAESEGAGLIDALIYLPLDFPWVVNSVMKKVNPALFVIVEKEYWPNILRSVTKRSIPVVVVNGTISERSYKGYCRALWFFKGIFGSLSCFCARTRVDAERATVLGVKSDKVEVLGNLKFDMAKPSSTISTEDLTKALKIDSTDLVIVAGSTHPGEEEFFIDIYGELKDELPNLKMILAPRHPERSAQVAKMVEASGLKLSLRSLPASIAGDSEVIVLDTLGELFTAYSLASVAFVGGSLVDIGGHNLLEPAFFSKPVLFGPHIYTCSDMASVILAEEAGVKVTDKEELKRALMELLTDTEERKMMGERAALLLDSLRGATLKTVQRLEKIVSLK